MKNLTFFYILILIFSCTNSKKSETKYEHQVGYINPESARLTNNFELCNEKDIKGYYSSYAPKVYKPNKRSFRHYIKENYINKNYNDYGFLNLRFHINCKGEVGNLEVNELNTNLELADLDDNLVDQLVNLSMQESNWNAAEYKGVKYDAYMYLIFKIENGNVTEILP